MRVAVQRELAAWEAAAGCAEYAQKLEGESPLPNLMEVKG
jgi:hypothetical protein